MIALAYRGKIDNGKKENSKKANFLSYFLEKNVLPHCQVFQQRRNGIIHMGEDLYTSLSNVLSS